MPLSFGRFELDEAGRTLRLDGQDRPMQPLVFDLLVYLIEHRARVVSKDELLTQLWGDTVVTDGSLQRAVSLLRAVLRDGDLPEAVQTFARRGYRFCLPLPGHERAVALELSARQLADAGQWESALSAFAELEPSSLTASDWEAWGTAAICAGKPNEALLPLERAVALLEAAADLEGAARVALLLTNVKLETRELAIAKGWHERARSYLKAVPECKEHGLSAWLSSRFALFENRFDECRAHADAARAIGDRLGDPDLHCLGLIYYGHILIAQGEVRRGLGMHDEAGAAALAGRVSTYTGGIVFCSVIWAYLHLGDQHRASQWTSEFSRWCERNPDYCYPALCRLHCSEVFALRGELEQAETEVRRAREQLAIAGPFVEGDACRVLGEIKLSRGDLDGAELAFREAHRLGWNPQPGLSLLLAARGERSAAIKQLERALAEPTWTDGQRRGVLLAVLARICAVSGELERARSALSELLAQPVLSATPVAAAELAYAEGALAYAEGDAERAEAALRRSISQWLEMGSPVQAAQVRLRLCELLQASDPTAAELELGSAEAVFQQVGAELYVARCRALRTKQT
jgi:tetratricopeptide (TPR) repeat protein